MIKQEWLPRLARYERLWVGLSGGIDSTVLLHSLISYPVLANKIRAVHVHHGLSAHADRWQRHCQQFCHNLNILLDVHHVKIVTKTNIEEGARRARYTIFEEILSEQDALLLAHHADDQAETVLLQLFRGAGIAGLAGIPKERPLGKARILRPFLAITRREIEQYAEQHRLTWVNDESNDSDVFSRNYIRHQVLPWLQKRWPGIKNNLITCAEHCQQAQINLEALAEFDYEKLNSVETLNTKTLSLAGLLAQPRARIANVLRFWLKKNAVQPPSTKIFNRLIDEMIYAKIDASPCVAWGEVSVRRYHDVLYLLPRHRPYNNLSPIQWSNFPQTLYIQERGLAIEVREGLCEPSEQRLIYLPKDSKIEVRFRQGGEKIRFGGQTKSLKRLFQQWGVPPWQRDEVPLIYLDDQLIVVVGYAVSDNYSSSSMLNDDPHPHVVFALGLLITNSSFNPERKSI